MQTFKVRWHEILTLEILTEANNKEEALSNIKFSASPVDGNRIESRAHYNIEDVELVDKEELSKMKDDPKGNY